MTDLQRGRALYLRQLADEKLESEVVRLRDVLDEQVSMYSTQLDELFAELERRRQHERHAQRQG